MSSMKYRMLVQLPRAQCRCSGTTGITGPKSGLRSRAGVGSAVVRVALAMVVRDEADIVEQHLRFHFAVGVDVVLATDHGSTDGTREILESYAREGLVRLFHGEGKYNRQGEWMTRMVQLAATELGVDWVLCSDGDEFWWPSGGSVKTVLAAVPRRYGTLHVLSQSFVPLADDGRPFAERMTVRLSPPAPVNDPAAPYRPVAKVAHRGHPKAVVSNGNHEVRGVPGVSLRGWFPIELLHFPLRSSEQAARKYKKTWLGWERNPRADLARARSAADNGQTRSIYERVAVGQAELERGLGNGSLVHDTRLNEVLRAIDGADDPSAVASRNHRHPVEVAVLAEAELVRFQRRLDSLGRRAAEIGASAHRGGRPDAVRL